MQIGNSLKRIAQADGLAEPKYTTQQAVEAKVGRVQGWEDLLSFTGFHFIGSMKDVPATIVFPEHDDSGLQRRALRHLEALLGLPQACLLALATLSKQPQVAAPLLNAVSGSPNYYYITFYTSSISSRVLSQPWRVPMGLREECTSN